MAPSEPRLLATYEVFAAGFLMRPLRAMSSATSATQAGARQRSPTRRCLVLSVVQGFSVGEDVSAMPIQRTLRHEGRGIS